MYVDLGGANGFIENAATARVYGLDVDGSFRLTDELTLGASLTLLNAHYVSYKNAAGLVPLFVGGKADGNTLSLVDASGNQMPRAPDVALTASADYKKPFSAGLLELNATVSYSGRIYYDSIERVSQSPYAVLNLQASWKPAGTRFEFIAWGHNVTNTTYLGSAYEDGEADRADYAPPATYGVAVRYSF